MLGAHAWNIALLQEAPPRWFRALGDRLGASGASALTARNALPGLRSLLARINPDLMASAEGGSNQVLVRSPWRIEDVARETLTRRPERRRLLLVRVADSSGARLAVANLHASTGRGARTIADVLRAADLSVAWARGLPLVFGGDLNVTGTDAPGLFSRLEREYGLRGATGDGAIDHVLVRHLVTAEAPRPLPVSARELPGPGGRSIRLSDHPCVVATFEME